MRAAVLGAGGWGTTLAIVLAENDHEVALWDRDPARAEATRRARENETFLPGVELPERIATAFLLLLAAPGLRRRTK